MLTFKGLGVVLADLSSMGFDAKWGVVSAADIGANHIRERIWIRAETNVSNSKSGGNRRITGKLQAQNEQQAPKRQEKRVCKFDNASNLGNSYCLRELQPEGGKQNKWGWTCDSSWWKVEPNVGRMADGVAARVDRFKSLGNGQVPFCAATAWELLK